MGDKDCECAIRWPTGIGLLMVISHILTTPSSVCFLFRDLRGYLTAPSLRQTYTISRSWCQRVNCRQRKSLSENFTISTLCPEPVLFPDQDRSTLIYFFFWKVQQKSRGRLDLKLHFYYMLGLKNVFAEHCLGELTSRRGPSFSLWKERIDSSQELTSQKKKALVCVMCLRR